MTTQTAPQVPKPRRFAWIMAETIGFTAHPPACKTFVHMIPQTAAIMTPTATYGVQLHPMDFRHGHFHPIGLLAAFRSGLRTGVLPSPKGAIWPKPRKAEEQE